MSKKIISLPGPGYTIQSASGTRWSLCIVEYIDHNQEETSDYKTLKWVPLDENGEPEQ